MVYYGHMMDYGMGYGYFGLVWNALFWVALILLIVWIVKKGNLFKETRSASEILKIRYAKGEITKKQFEEMRKGIKE